MIRSNDSIRYGEACEVAMAEKLAGPGASAREFWVQMIRLAEVDFVEMMADGYMMEHATETIATVDDVLAVEGETSPMSSVATVDEFLARASNSDVQAFRDGLDGFLDDLLNG